MSADTGDQALGGRRGHAYRRVDLAIAAGLLLVGIGAVAGARTIPPPSAFTYDPIGPRGFAYGVGALCAAVSLGLLVSLAVRYRRDVRRGEPIVEDTTVTGDDPRYPASSRRALTIMVLTLAYALVLLPLGYVVATVLHLVACLYLMGVRSRRVLIWFPLGFALASYLLFHTLLDVRLPGGVLGPVLDLAGVA